MQCGTALSPWSLTDDPLKWAFKAGEILGFKGDDRLELLKFFRALPGDQIVNVANRLLEETTVVFFNVKHCLPTVSLVVHSIIGNTFSNIRIIRHEVYTVRLPHLWR